MTTLSDEVMRPEAAERALPPADQIERLLDEIRASSGPTGWSRVEELVSALVELYGAGFARLLRHMRDVATDLPELESRLAADELLSSLLSLHGLHPLGLEVRVRQALDGLEKRLGDPAIRFELVTVDSQRVELRLVVEDGSARARALADVAKRAVAEAAPEIGEIVVLGLPEAPVSAPALIPVERLLPRGRP